jgi:SAM-dependent methyltransferase
VSRSDAADPSPTDAPADPSNTGQAEAWNGPTGAFWADNADRFDAGMEAYRAPMLAAVGTGGADVVLDVGCGAGQLTRDLARTAGSALGVDLSERLLDLARARAEAEGLANVAFRRADAQVHPFGDAAFDVVTSRNGVMFFGDPVAAFTNLTRALRPGGRMVLMTWQPFEHQEWLRTFRRVLGGGRDLPPPPDDGPSPLGLSDPERVRGILAAAGLVDVTVEGLRHPMVFGSDPDDALTHVAGLNSGLIGELDEPARTAALEALRTDLAAHRGAGGVQYDSATWVVRARKP